MDKFLNICKALCLLSFCALCIFSTLFIRKATASLDHVNTTMTGIDTVVTGANTALATINRPKTGVLAETTKSILAFKSTLTHADIALAHEDRNLTTLDRQELTLFTDVHNTLLSAQGSLSEGRTLLATTNQTVLGFQPVITQSEIAIGGLTTNLDTLHTLLSDPAIPATLHSAQTISENTAAATGHLDAASEDVQTWFHNLLHPTWYARVQDWVLTVGSHFVP